MLLCSRNCNNTVWVSGVFLSVTRDWSYGPSSRAAVNYLDISRGIFILISVFNNAANEVIFLNNWQFSSAYQPSSEYGVLLRRVWYFFPGERALRSNPVVFVGWIRRNFPKRRRKCTHERYSKFVKRKRYVSLYVRRKFFTDSWN